MRSPLLVTALPALALLLGGAGTALGQAPPLTTPESSPKASVSQTVGLTEMTIAYHRPAVAKRKIWGDLVPYGEVWRAGANANTTLSFSTPVEIGGKTVPAGTYGLHMLPTEKEWTVILSTVSTAWGSYSYTPKEDAVRVTVTPEATDFTERLSYSFDEPTNDSVSVVLRWEKLKVAFKVTVDTPAVVRASMRAELRGLPRFFWQGWNEAAQYWLRSGGDLGEAEKMVGESLQIQETFQNLNTKAAILEKKGDAKQAAALRTKALGLATQGDLNQYGYSLLGQKKVDEAIEIFRKNAKDHPGSWNAHDSLAEAFGIKGDKKSAIESYSKALSLVKDEANRKRIEQTIARLRTAK
jgi:tetratricopeptide (TPR) repeat protein